MDIQIYDYLKEVETARKNLIQHCKDFNRPVDDSATLSTVVGAIQTIENYQDKQDSNQQRDYENTVEVRFFDCDGTLLKQEIIPKGGSITPPENPNYDPDRLEFNKWVSAIGEVFDYLEHDVDYGATYKLKDNIQYVYFCNFTEYTGKSIYMPIYFQYSGTHTIYIDWGDGSDVTSQTISGSASKYFEHNYVEYGNYIITIKMDDSFVANTSKYIYPYVSKSTGNGYKGILNCGSSYNKNQIQKYDTYTTDFSIYKIYAKYAIKNVTVYCKAIDTFVSEIACINYSMFGTEYTSSPSATQVNNSPYYNIKNIIIPESIDTFGYNGNNSSYCRSLVFNMPKLLIISDKAFKRAKCTISSSAPTQAHWIIQLYFNQSLCNIDKLILPKMHRAEGNTASTAYQIGYYGSVSLNSFMPCKHLIALDYFTSFYGSSSSAVSYINVDRLDIYKPLNVEQPAFRYGFTQFNFNSSHIEIPDTYMSERYNAYTLYSNKNIHTLTIDDNCEYASAISTYQPNITYLNIPMNFNYNLSLSNVPNISDQCIVDILNKIKDLTSEPLAKTITLPNYNYGRFLSLNVINNNGIYELSDSLESISFIDALTLKNWTVSISWDYR